MNYNELVDYGRLVDTMNWPLLTFIVSHCEPWLRGLLFLRSQGGGAGAGGIPGLGNQGKAQIMMLGIAWHRLAVVVHGLGRFLKILEDLGSQCEEL
jgi:hypothetical protein